MKVKNTIAAICGIVLIACMATGLPVFAAETTEVEYVDIDGDGKISDAEREYAHALKMVQDFNETYDAVMADYNALVAEQQAAAEAEAELKAIEEAGTVQDETTTQETTSSAQAATTTSAWNGKQLSKSAGTVMGPSGKEVYYNMNMTSVIDRAHARGIDGEFWVRSDGVKMLGEYIMAAVSFDVHPYGSTFETSLGTAIAVDTGGFASSNPTMIDIAVRW